jgi:hypothetical protein
LREFLVWMEASALGHYMRESGPWTYAVVNLSHILGVATLFGSVLVLDFRLLGCWRRIPIATLASATTPVATVGFGIAALTGTALLATKATDYLNNPFFDIKFPAIALGLINVLILNLSPAWRARGTRELSRGEHRQLAVMGGISIACWLTAVSAGRMIGYW